MKRKIPIMKLNMNPFRLALITTSTMVTMLGTTNGLAQAPGQLEVGIPEGSPGDYGTGADIDRSLTSSQGGALPAGTVANAPKYYRIDSNNLPPIQDQGAWGSCTAFAACGALQREVFKELGRTILLNPDSYYKNVLKLPKNGYPTSLMVVGDVRNGIVGQVLKTGIPSFSPGNPAGGYRTIVAKKSGSTKDKEAMRRILASGRPLIANFSVPVRFPFYKSGVYSETEAEKRFQAIKFALPREWQSYLDYRFNNDPSGHAVFVIGYIKAGATMADVSGAAAVALPQNLRNMVAATQNVWICQNSWGTKWGENGIFYIAEGEPGNGRDNTIDDEMWWVEGAAYQN